MPKPSTERAKKSPAGVDRAFRQLLQVLPVQWKCLMVTLGTYVYGNKIRSPEQLLRVILLYCGADLSLLELSLVMRLQGVEISKQGLDKRLNRCGEFLQWLVKEVFEINELPSLPGQRRFLACDGTELSRPGPHSPRLRLHLCIELLSLSFVQMQLTGSKQGETLKRFEFRPGDVVLADRGFCRYQSVMYVALDCKADVLVRWHPAFPVYESRDAEQAMELHEKLQGQAEKSITSLSVWVKYSQKSKRKNKRELQGTLHIYKMTKDEAERSQRTLLKNYKRKNRPLNPTTAFLSQFVILFTTVHTLEISAETAMALYRCRWQIELAIKSLKSLLHIKKLRANPQSRMAEVYIWGKLLYMLLIDKKVRSCFEQDWTGLGSQQRRLTFWAPTKLLKGHVDSVLLQSHRWKPRHIAQCAEALTERRKGRPLQTLPPALLRLAPPCSLAAPPSLPCPAPEPDSKALRLLPPPPARRSKPRPSTPARPKQLLLKFPKLQCSA
jgi:hypothetical protein